jgi:lysophospholipase L1-like esterase
MISYRKTAATLLAMAGTATLLVGSGPRAVAEADTYRYVALGDSYTAAPLVPSVIVANGCYRSTHNYPHVVANMLSATMGAIDFVDASCSGAQTKDMFASQLPGVPPQLDAVTPDTDLVTVSIGGNDFSVFGTLVGYCPTLPVTKESDAPCRDAMRSDGQDKLLAAIAQTEQRVDGVIAAVKERAPGAQVVVVGYPQLLPRSGTCPALMPTGAGDYRYGNQVNERLTLALQQPAARHHVDYADVWSASQGHDICSADPWINGQFTDPTRAASFHPFANEQAAVAELVVAEVESTN